MPVRLLSSPVLKWPDAQNVNKAVRRWVEDIHQNRKDVLRIGYFGSYARGEWGVTSISSLLLDTLTCLLKGKVSVGMSRTYRSLSIY